MLISSKAQHKGGRMDLFEAVDSVHIKSDPADSILVTFKMRYPGTTGTLVLMEHCQHLLSSSLKPLFPKPRFVYSTSESMTEFTCEVKEGWTQRDDDVFEFFVRALTRRYSHIKYYANKKHRELAPWS